VAEVQRPQATPRWAEVADEGHVMRTHGDGVELRQGPRHRRLLDCLGGQLTIARSLLTPAHVLPVRWNDDVVAGLVPVLLYVKCSCAQSPELG